MEFFFCCYFPWREWLWWSMHCKMVGSKNQYTVIFLFILSFLIISLSGQSAPQQLHILHLCHLLVLREGNILVPLLHKCHYCMWHTGAVCISTNKMDLRLPQIVIFTVPDLYSAVSAQVSMVHWKSQVLVTAIYIDLTVI